MSEPSEPRSPTRLAGAGPQVEVDDDQSDHPLDPTRWAHLAQAALVHQGITAGELTVSFVDETTIAELNAAHMGVDGPTDVLSFPLDADGDDASADADADANAEGGGVPVLLGDVVICPAVAARTAPTRLTTDPHPGHPDHDGTLDAELALLVVHGVLHVCGHDHAEDSEREAMWAAEAAILTTSTGPERSDR